MSPPDERQDINTRVLVDRVKGELHSSIKELATTLKSIEKDMGRLDIDVQRQSAQLEHVVTNGKLLGLAFASVALIFSGVGWIVQSGEARMKEDNQRLRAEMVAKQNESDRRIAEWTNERIREQQSPPLEPLIQRRRR